jgi:omega-hydroxy-beta-dihydromenaquinone-9 sulfotransferase
MIALECYDCMPYNSHLFLRTAMRSFINTSNTHARLKHKRLIFVLLFYCVWPWWTLFTGLCFWLDDFLFPLYRQQPVEKPLFILGNFRSGSTFLHRLLSRDKENFTSLRTWDIFITPSITQRKIAELFAKADSHFGNSLRKLIAAIDEHSLGRVNFHHTSFFEPEEDENILLHIWSTFFIGVMFPFLDELPPYQFFDDAIPKRERKRIMQFYRGCIQRHLYATGGKKYFVSKNPAFSAKIETLMDIFPDARIIYLVRNPLDMLPSTVSWLSYAWHIFGVPLEKYPFRRKILDFTQYWYRHPLDYLDCNPSQNKMIMLYDDLIRRPEEVIHSFYNRFGYTDQLALERIVQDAVDNMHRFQSEHVYAYEEMGFTREQILASYADIFARFGFDQREPTSSTPMMEKSMLEPVPMTD